MHDLLFILINQRDFEFRFFCKETSLVDSFSLQTQILNFIFKLLSFLDWNIVKLILFLNSQVQFVFIGSTRFSLE